ncbi:MAG TPA: hypothetical protein DCW83_05815 [Saprospirales bacterium]|nr:hypothetical protein [Saprospirales bacterium]
MSFEFLREGRVWLEYDSTFYLLHTDKDISFSQTFRQEDTTVRSLHNNSDFFEDSSIVDANPADFSFSIYLIANDSTPLHQHKPLDLLTEYSTDNNLNTFNLYFVYSDYSPETYYKIENCVFTAGSFNIPRNGIMTVGLSGQGTKLTRNTGPGSPIPAPSADYTSSPNFAISKQFDIWATGTSVAQYKLDNIIGASLELQNNVNWTSNNTLQKSLLVTDADTTIYPENFTLDGRSLAGSIVQYISESQTLSNDNVQTWAENTSVIIKAGLGNSYGYQLEVDLDNRASFTNRATFGDVFTQSYDFRCMGNPAMNSIFTY